MTIQEAMQARKNDQCPDAKDQGITKTYKGIHYNKKSNFPYRQISGAIVDY
jgi:hypothetical protein